ncbi:MAG TPA: acyltransferase, partial [Steroidobacteraceae bacterium]|nr:acyltransferase [Steroidobacteraceae bacterium]
MLRALIPGFTSFVRAAPSGTAGAAVDANPGRRLAVLDGWRGVSILIVVVSHLLSYRYAGVAPNSHETDIWEALATCGVCIFFVISGFIIVRLALQERETAGRFHAGAFYVRRCFRILPPYFLYLAFVLATSAYGLITQPVRQTLPAFLFACNLPAVKCGWFAGHSWSLAYEEQFYILMPLLMLWGRTRPVLVALAALLVGFPLISRFVLHAGHAGFVLGHAAHYFSFIAVGALAATYAHTLKRWAQSRHADWITVAAAVALAAAVWLEILGHEAADTARYSTLRTLFVPAVEPVS